MCNVLPRYFYRGLPREQYRSVPRGGVKKGSVADRESGVALCHGVALKKEKKKDRSWTERAVSLCATGVAL